MVRKYQKKHPIAEINVVPYIDVMLVLLIIFMITAPLLNQGIQVDLPKTSANALKTQNKEPIIVSINNKGQYYLNISNTPSQVMNPSILIQRVAAELTLSKQQGQERQVFVKGDHQVDYGSVVQLMTLLQQSGATGIGLITSPANNEHPKNTSVD